MARMHARRKGRSGSKRPVRTEVPRWVPLKPEEAREIVIKLHKEGLSTAEIGIRLRDQYGVPTIKELNGQKISQILNEAGLSTGRFPEDITNLMRKAVNLHAHLRRNPKDLHNRRAMSLIEAKIRRLERYYRRKKRLPPGWKYTIDNARLLVD